MAPRGSYSQMVLFSTHMKETGPHPPRFAELVGDRLRRLRQAAGLSLQDVCDRSGGAFVVSTLSAYEHGKRSLGLERLVELADIYGVSPMTLLDVEEPDEPALARMKPLRINLRNIQNLAPDERPPLEQYLDFLRRLRNDPARRCSPSDARSRTWPLYGYGPKP